MRAAITKRAEATLADLRTQLRDKRIRHTGMNRVGNGALIESSHCGVFGVRFRATT